MCPILSPSLSSFSLWIFSASCAALANWAFRGRPWPTSDSDISGGVTYQSLRSWDISLDTVACGPFSASPSAFDSPGCTAPEAFLSNSFCIREYPIAERVEPEFKIELGGMVQTLGLDTSSNGLYSQSDLNSKQLSDTLYHFDHCSSSPWIGNFDLQDDMVNDLRCDWPQCSSLGLFESIEKHKSHLKQHARDVSNHWSPGLKCTWHKCSSKASHRSRNLFEAHLNNIHLNPLVCTVKHCKHKTPFRANHDLQRHIATAHNVDSKYKCPYISCPSRAFIRKDKWMSHLKEHHDTEPCPYEHCQRRTENVPFHQRSVSRHIGKAHSNFECALQSCKGKTSRFKESQLLEHLQLHHAMEWALVLKARDTMKADGDRTLTSDYLKKDLNVRDCKICTEGS